MPKFTAGDVIEVVCNHPTLGDFRFYPKANEAFTYDPGGVRSNDDENGVTGSGIMIDQMNNKRWFIEGPVAVDLMSNNELANLPALANDPAQGVWTITHISGDIRKGTGKYVGDIQVDTNTAQLKMKAAGGGKLEKIA